MNKNNTTVHRTLPLTSASLGALGGLQPAAVDVLLYDRDGTAFSSDGYFSAFYVSSDADRQGETYDHRQSRMKMGFPPNYIGLNFSRKTDELSLGGHASFWMTISDSETNGTDITIGVHQLYGTVAGDWGEVLIGKDFGLFSRSNIFLGELLAGFSNLSDTPGLVDDKSVSFGDVGTGYPYPFPTSQITYRNNDLLLNLCIAMGILDPIDPNQIDKDAGDGLDDKAYQDNSRYESEASYQFDLVEVQVYSWINGGYQTSKNTSDSVDSVTSKGVGYGSQVKMGGLSVTGPGPTAKGINPFFTSSAGEVALREVGNRDALSQGSYSWGKDRLTLSCGKTVDDGSGLGSAANYESRGIAYPRMINDNLKLVAELNRCRIDGCDDVAFDEGTGTVAFSIVSNW